MLALSSNVALKVQPPTLRLPRTVAKRPQRDRELGHPTHLADMSAYDEARVPVEIEPAPGPRLCALAAGRLSSTAFLADLTVILDPAGLVPKTNPFWRSR